jgi:peptidylamidoglycolate lyase
LALAEEKEMLFVADRENGRIVVYNCHNGQYLFEIKSELLGSRVFAVSYTPVDGKRVEL